MVKNARAGGLAAVCLWVATAATAQPAARSYAVVSEVARQVSVVSFQETTGSRLNNNRRQRIDVPDGALDKVFLVSAQKALKQATPGAEIWLLAPADSDFFSPLQSSQGAKVSIPEDLLAALRERKSSHLLVFTRHRDDADLRFVNVTDSTGQLEGLGYYVDHHSRVRLIEAKEVGVGYLASFTHFRATLIDLATSQVVGTAVTRANIITPVAGAQSGSAHPWDALTPAQKMSQLRDLVISEVERMVPEVVGAKP